SAVVIKDNGSFYSGTLNTKLGACLGSWLEGEDHLSYSSTDAASCNFFRKDALLAVFTSELDLALVAGGAGPGSNLLCDNTVSALTPHDSKHLRLQQHRACLITSNGHVEREETTGDGQFVYAAGVLRGTGSAISRSHRTAGTRRRTLCRLRSFCAPR